MARIEVTKVGDYFLLTSPEVPGLYVSDKDLEVAEARVEPSLKALKAVQERLDRERTLSMGM